MCSVLLIDKDLFRATDLFIRLEDEGFKVLGPIASSEEGFRFIADQQLCGVVVNSYVAGKYFPELYDLVIESTLPVAFLDSQTRISNFVQKRCIVFKEGDDLAELKSLFGTPICSRNNSKKKASYHINKLIQKHPQNKSNLDNNT